MIRLLPVLNLVPSRSTIPGDLTIVGNLTVNGSVTVDVDETVTGNVTVSGVLTTTNTGLHLLDTDASHDLIISPGSNLTADRTLTITTGDAARTLTLSSNVTLNQNVDTTATPTFADLTISDDLFVSSANLIVMQQVFS